MFVTELSYNGRREMFLPITIAFTADCEHHHAFSQICIDGGDYELMLACMAEDASVEVPTGLDWIWSGLMCWIQLGAR